MNIDEVNLIIAKGPAFTQGPNAVVYSVPRHFDFNAFRGNIKDQLREENEHETRGLERSHIVLKDNANASIKSKQDFIIFMSSNPEAVKVEIQEEPGSRAHSSTSVAGATATSLLRFNDIEYDQCTFIEPTFIHKPWWLKVALPAHFSPHDSLTDLRLPLKTNPFYKRMMSDMSGTEMENALMHGTEWCPQNYNNVIMLGSSGCGKTSSCFATAAVKWVIYMEAPTTSRPEGFSEGIRMSAQSSNNAVSESVIHQQFLLEVAARLVVLSNLISAHRRAEVEFFPLQWLVFCLSKEGGMRIRKTRTNLGPCFISTDWLNTLLEEVRTSSSHGNPVVIVDEAQLLYTNLCAEGKTYLRCMNAAAAPLNCSKVWCGTRVSVNAAMSLYSPVFKSNDPVVQLLVVGNYRYLDPDVVGSILDEIIAPELYSTKVRAILACALQGRARMLAYFFALLLPADKQLPVPTDSNSFDNLLLATLERTYVRAQDDFSAEIRHFTTIPHNGGLNDQRDLDSLWLRLSLNQAEEVHRRTQQRRTYIDAKCRDDSLVFVEGVVAQQPVRNLGDTQSVTINVNFIPRYGEQGLLEAVQRIILNAPNRKIRVQGVVTDLLKRVTFDRSALGSVFDYALALSLLMCGPSFLSTYCIDPQYETYKLNYTVSLRRVVAVSTVQEQLEFLHRAMRDPDDVEFSLMPGIPVKHIAILPHKRSGADLLFMATRKSTIEEPSSPGTESKNWVFRTRKRKADAEANVVALHSAVSPTVLVHVCATVTETPSAEKIVDQERKSMYQFVHSGGMRSTEEEEYINVQERALSDRKLVYLPHVFEVTRSAKKLASPGINCITAETALQGELFSTEAMELLTAL